MADEPIIDTNVYQDISAADAYMVNSVRGAINWSELSITVKARCLITATRILDKQPWQGTKTSDTQDLQWPRENVYDRNGNLVDSTTVPDGINFGSVELAYDLSQDSDVEVSGGEGSNIKRIDVDTVSIQYFKGTGGPGGVGSVRFSPNVMEYIGEYLESGSSIAGSAYGTEGTTGFDEDASYPLNWPYP